MVLIFVLFSVTVQSSSKTVDGGRVYDKKHACFFCGKEFFKIARHLENCHSKESEVVKALSYSAGCKERKLELEKIRLLGNFHHNRKVLAVGKGELKVLRRPGEKYVLNPSDFLPCIHCHGFVQKHELWRHAKLCPFRSAEDKKLKRRNLQAEGALLIAPMVSQSDGRIQNVLAAMKQDDITNTVRGDEAILTFGLSLYEKVGEEKITYVSQRMREVARLLQELRNVDKTGTKLEDFIKPEKFDLIIKAVRRLCIFEMPSDGTTPRYGTPSLALKLGNSLKKCAAVIRGVALRTRNDEQKENVNCYLQLHETEWCEKISAAALSTLDDRKHNQPQILPVTSDLVKMRKYVLEEVEELVNNLKEDPNTTTWTRFAEVTATRVIVFNKRRGGEAAKLRVMTYRERPVWHDVRNQEMYSSLSRHEQELCKR